MNGQHQSRLDKTRNTLAELDMTNHVSFRLWLDKNKKNNNNNKVVTRLRGTTWLAGKKQLFKMDARLASRRERARAELASVTDGRVRMKRMTSFYVMTVTSHLVELFSSF